MSVFIIVIIAFFIIANSRAGSGGKGAGSTGSRELKNKMNSLKPAEPIGYAKRQENLNAGSDKSVSDVSAKKSDTAGTLQDMKPARYGNASGYGSNHRSRASVSERRSVSDMEDREHDWLAAQIREEARMKRSIDREMYDLKAEHLREHDKIHG